MSEERPTIDKVLEKVKELSKKVQSIEIGEGPHDMQVIVSKQRVIYYDVNYNLYEFNLNKGLKSKLQGKKEFKITALHVSQDGSRCYIGQSDGKLRVRDLLNHPKVEDKVYNVTDSIVAITSYGEAVYLILLGGTVLGFDGEFKSQYSPDTQIKTFSSCLKVSPNGKYLVFDQMKDIRKMLIFNIQGEKQIGEPFTLQCFPWDFDKVLVFSKSSNLFTLSASQKSIINISLLSGKAIQSTVEHSSKISQILVSQDEETVYSCSKESQILVWDWTNLTSKKLVSHGCQIESLALSKNENLLFAGSCKNKLTIWNTKFLFKLAEIDFKRPLTHLSLSEFDNNLVAMSWSKEKVEISYLPLQDYHLQIQDELSPFCYITPNQEHLAIPVAWEQCIRIWNMNQRKIVGQIAFQGVKPSKYLLNGTRDSKYIFAQISKMKFVIWDCGNEKEHERRSSNYPINGIIINTDSQTFYLNTTSGFLVFKIGENLDNDSREIEQPKVKGELIYTVFTKQVIYSCYSDKKSHIQLFQPSSQKQWDLEEISVSSEHELLVQPTDGNKGTIQFILISNDMRYIKIGSFTDRLDQVSIKNATQFKQLDSSIQVAAFDDSGQYFIAKSSEKTIIWQTDDWKEIFFTQDQVEMVRTFNGAFIGFIHQGCYKPWKKTIEFYSSFDDYDLNTEGIQNLKTEKFEQTQISGTFNKIAPFFFSSMLDSKKMEQTKYIHLLKDNVIYPQKVNLGHICAYNNNVICLQQCLEQNILYGQDSIGKFPLNYAFDRKSAQSCSTILEYFMREDENVYSKLTPNDLVALIEVSPPNLKEFLDNSMINNDEKEIPSHAELVPSSFLDGIGGYQFGTDIRYLVTGNAQLKESDLNSLVKEGQISKNAKSIEMCSLKFKYDFTPGSNQSIQLLQSLSNHEEKSSFRSPTLQHIIWYKWLQVRTFAYLEAVIKFLCYIILFVLLVRYGDKAMQKQSDLSAISVYSVISERNILMVIACFLQAYDLIFLVAPTVYPNRLVRNIWKWLSMIQHPLLIVAVNVDFSENLKALQSILGCINILYWTQCVSLLRLWKTTRVLLYMLRYVLWKMIPFLIVLQMAIAGFSLTFHILRIEYFDRYLSALANVYTLIFGDFDTEGFDRAGWVIFCLASFLTTLVLMNLLIAVMGDSYNEAMSQKIPSDYQELVGIILDKERKFFYWNRTGKPGQHLHFAKYTTTFDKEAWEGASGAIMQQGKQKKQISEMRSQIMKLSSQKEELDKQIIQLKQNNSYWKNKINALEEGNKDRHQARSQQDMIQIKQWRSHQIGCSQDMTRLLLDTKEQKDQVLVEMIYDLKSRHLRRTQRVRRRERSTLIYLSLTNEDYVLLQLT